MLGGGIRGWRRSELRLSGGSKLSGFNLLERGNLQVGLAVVTQLPSHIPQRMASRAENLLHQTNLRAVVLLRERGNAPAGVFVYS